MTAEYKSLKNEIKIILVKRKTTLSAVKKSHPSKKHSENLEIERS